MIAFADERKESYDIHLSRNAVHNTRGGFLGHVSHVIASLILFFGVVTNAQAADFEGQKNFSAVSLSGQIEVRCLASSPGEPTWATYFCRANIIEPQDDPALGAYDMSHFNHQTPSDADEFELVSVHADGSTNKKSGRFDAVEGKSRSWVNLWIDTITQNPLLEVGENKITFSLTRKGVVKESGQFSSQVTWVGERRCPARSYFGQDGDCSNAYRFCDKFFREQSLCR